MTSKNDDDLEVLVNLKYLNELERESNILAALYAAGIDNWEGYDEAMKTIDE